MRQGWRCSTGKESYAQRVASSQSGRRGRGCQKDLSRYVLAHHDTPRSTTGTFQKSRERVHIGRLYIKPHVGNPGTRPHGVPWVSHQVQKSIQLVCCDALPFFLRRGGGNCYIFTPLDGDTSVACAFRFACTVVLGSGARRGMASGAFLVGATEARPYGRPQVSSSSTGSESPCCYHRRCPHLPCFT